MSVCAPWPLTIASPRRSRTVTSPWASVPEVMLLTEYSCSSDSVATISSMARNEASTGPLPGALPRYSRPPRRSTTCATGVSPSLERTSRSASWYSASAGAAAPPSSTSITRSSSTISCLRSASSLKRANTPSSSSAGTSRPRVSSASRTARRPECLPSTMRLPAQPTSWARMIS